MKYCPSSAEKPLHIAPTAFTVLDYVYFPRKKKNFKQAVIYIKKKRPFFCCSVRKNYEGISLNTLNLLRNMFYVAFLTSPFLMLRSAYQ